MRITTAPQKKGRNQTYFFFLTASALLLVGVTTTGYLDDSFQPSVTMEKPSLLPVVSTSTGGHDHNNFPPICSADQLATIRHQLPPDTCESNQNRPWGNKCSFSYATRCPAAVWVPAFFQEYRAKAKYAMYVGCNKGMDAINTLRMISNNHTIDKEKWKERFFQGESIVPGHCNQESEPQYTIPAGATVNNAVVYCIEAMPSTARHLQNVANALGLQDSLMVTNNAMASKDGSIFFPKVEDKVGTEGLGIADCKGSDKKNCAEVPMYTIDTYLSKYAKEKLAPIDLLSVDVEGFDYDVLLGGVNSLKRVRYLEFEYNWKGPWGKQSLSGAIDNLKLQGFACYFAGTEGHIWRITDCFHDYYNLHYWSNIACVNTNDPVVAPMAHHMEDLFQQTLNLGTTLQVSDMDSLSAKVE